MTLSTHPVSPTEKPLISLPHTGFGPLTIGHLLLGMIVVLAAVLRMVGLGDVPLAPREAAEALAIWHYWQPATALSALTAVAPTSPAYFSITTFLTQLVGDSAAVLRLVPALAGLVLVVLPWGLQSLIGRRAALVACFLLAISPTQISLARTVGGDSMALAVGLALVVVWGQWRQDGAGRWLVLGAAVLGVGISTSPIFYTAVVSLGGLWLLARAVGPQRSAVAADSTIPNRTLLVVGGLVALIVATFGSLNLPGLGATASILATWLGSFGSTAGLGGWLEPMLLLGRYEIAALGLGLVAAAWATWRNHATAVLLAYWYIIALVLLLVQPTLHGNVALLTLPAYLLVGLLVERVFGADYAAVETWVRWPLAGTLVLLGLVVAANLGRHARVQLYALDDVSYLSLALICLLMGMIMVAVVLVWDWRAAVQGLLVAALCGVAVLHIAQAWRIGHTGAADPRERWVVEATDDELPQMVAMVRQIARQTTGADTAATIFSTVDTPALRWYLRGLPVVYGQTVPPAAVYDMVLTPLGDDPALGSSYTGADWGYYRPPVEHVLGRSEALRWWFFAQSPQPMADTRLILWVRSDLVLR